MKKRLIEKAPSAKGDKTPIPFTPVGQLPSVLAMLAYGRSGTGKTTFASTFPKPLLLLDVREKGTDSISNVPNTKVGAIDTWEDFEKVYWYLAEQDHGYKTVVIDQVTQLQDLAIIKAMKDDGKAEKDAISKRNWGQGAGLMKTWLLNYRDLIDQNINVLFLAHDRAPKSGEDEEDGQQIDPVVGARVMPSIASFLNGAVKMIGNTFIQETFVLENKRKVSKIEYCMRIGPHAYYTTKTRSPVGIVSPSVVVNPTYDKMLQIMTGEYQEEKPKKQGKLKLKK